MKNAYYYFSLIDLFRSSGESIKSKRKIAASMVADLQKEETNFSENLSREERNAKASFLLLRAHSGYKVTIAQKDLLTGLSFAFRSLIKSGETQQQIGNAVLLIIQSEESTVKKNRHNSGVFSVVLQAIEKIKDLRASDKERSEVNSKNRKARTATPVIYGELKEDYRIKGFIAFRPSDSELKKRQENFEKWWSITPTELRAKKKTAGKLFVADQLINEDFKHFINRYRQYLEENKGYRRTNLGYLKSIDLCHRNLTNEIVEILSKRWVPEEKEGDRK